MSNADTLKKISSQKKLYYYSVNVKEEGLHLQEDEDTGAWTHLCNVLRTSDPLYLHMREIFPVKSCQLRLVLSSEKKGSA